jgi:hypothetical protein
LNNVRFLIFFKIDFFQVYDYDTLVIKTIK